MFFAVSFSFTWAFFFKGTGLGIPKAVTPFTFKLTTTWSRGFSLFLWTSTSKYSQRLLKKILFEIKTRGVSLTFLALRDPGEAGHWLDDGGHGYVPEFCLPRPLIGFRLSSVSSVKVKYIYMLSVCVDNNSIHSLIVF